RVVLSFHEFEKAPAPRRVLKRLQQIPADIYKMAVQGLKPSDSSRLLSLLDAPDAPPLVVLSMGEVGAASRILSPSRGAAFTFAAPNTSEGTAPGQYSAAVMKGLYRVDKIERDTRIFGVIASPVAHSMSPVLHNRALRQCGINGVYLPFRVEPSHLADFFRFAEDLPVDGFSVTLPHKQKVMLRLDGVDALARRIGAVNTVFREGKRWWGTNTDAIGVTVPLENRISLRGATALVVGTGGAARAAVFALKAKGSRVAIAGRDPKKVRSLARATDVEGLDWQQALDRGFDILVQSTPIGGVLVNVTPPDANGDGNGTTGFSRNYATGASVQLSAASVSGFHVFERWVVGGVSQPVGQNVVNITMPAAGTTALAQYTDPSELTAYAGPDDEVVAGESTMLEGSSAGGDAPLFFSWSPAESLSSPASDQTLAEPSDTTTYTLTVTDIAGRIATDTVTLHVVEPLKVAVGAAQTVLANQTFVVSGVVTGGARPYSYEWSSAASLEPSTGESVFGKTSVSTSVTLSVTDAKGRTGSDTATVAVASLVSVDAGEDQIIEIGLGTTLSGSVSGGVPPYTFIWMPSGIPATVDQSVIRVEPSETTDYALAVTDDLGQRAVDTVRVAVVSPLTVSAGDAVEIELGDVVVLNGSAAGGMQPYRYRWSPAGGLSDAENKRPQVTPDQTTSYTLAVTDDEGQTAQTSVTITVVAPPPPAEVSAPTVGPCGVGLLPVLAIVTASLLPMRRKRRSRW
ncbi:MAG: type I 3-dehydroquinate dehydratase, partial [Planctomycetes bacterium]|nr:type I 3-dehydroquinate dehydratase [Planctomycetota bacterium]